MYTIRALVLLTLCWLEYCCDASSEQSLLLRNAQDSAAALAVPLSITAGPRLIQRKLSSSVDRYTQEVVTSLRGRESVLSGADSLCGFVTSDIRSCSNTLVYEDLTLIEYLQDYPLACPVSQICYSFSEYLECCTGTSIDITNTTTSYTNTISSNVRGQYNTTYTTTYPRSYLNTRTWYYGCTGQSKCYDSTAAASCVGNCSLTASLCTDWWAPYCASFYVAPGFTTSGIAYFCDTEAYGLEYYGYGYWPSSTSTYTTVVNNTYGATTPATWTPTVVPYSVTQGSRPASAATVAVATQTSGSSSAAPIPLSMIRLCLGFLLCSLMTFD